MLNGFQYLQSPSFGFGFVTSFQCMTAFFLIFLDLGGLLKFGLKVALESWAYPLAGFGFVTNFHCLNQPGTGPLKIVLKR